MTSPALAAQRFLLSLAVGAALGLWYGFLRPLRPRHTLLGDGLFLLGAGYGWLYQSFAICDGDLRLAYAAGLPLGAVLWELTAGKGLRRVFRAAWAPLRWLSAHLRRGQKKVTQKNFAILKNNICI